MKKIDKQTNKQTNIQPHEMSYHEGFLSLQPFKMFSPTLETIGDRESGFVWGKENWEMDATSKEGAGGQITHSS